jgi:hypothetical protein
MKEFIEVCLLFKTEDKVTKVLAALVWIHIFVLLLILFL